MRQRLALLMAGVGLIAGAHGAQAQVYKVTLAAANEIPPTASAGTGAAVITLNPTTHEMRVSGVFSGLVGPSSASHVHCCVAQPGNAGVATTVPSFAGFPLNVTSGAWDRVYDMRLASSWNPAFIAANGGGTVAGAEAAFLAGVAAGQTYLNLHSLTFPGGEIRGLLIRQSFASNAALSPTTRGAAAGLDSLGAGTGALSDAIVTLAFLSPAQQAAALEKLAPSASRGPWLATAYSMGSTFDQVDGRVDGLLFTDGAESQANGVWLKGNGIKGRQGSLDGFAGFDSDGWGIAGGLDHHFGSGGLVGAAVSYSDTSLSYRDQLDGNSDDVTSTQLTVYTARDVGRGYIDVMAAYAWQHNKSARDTSLSGVATGSYDGRQWGARIGGGVPMAVSSNVSVTPQAHLDWYDIKQDAYTEAGGGPLGLAVASRSADRVRSSLGAQLAFGANTGVQPFLRGFWNYDFQNDGLATSASFVSGGASFVTPGQRLDRNSFALGAGVNFEVRKSLSATLAYEATLSDSYQLHALQAKVRWAF
jgi:outer membrane autotransporter protein